MTLVPGPIGSFFLGRSKHKLGTARVKARSSRRRASSSSAFLRAPFILLVIDSVIMICFARPSNPSVQRQRVEPARVDGTEARRWSGVAYDLQRIQVVVVMNENLMK